MWTKTAMVIRPCNCYLQRWYLLAGELPTTALWCSPSVPSCEATHLSWVGFVIVGILVIVVIKVMVIVVINIMISAFFTIIIIGLFCKYSGSWALVGLLRSGQFSRTFCFFPDNSTRPIWCKKRRPDWTFFFCKSSIILGAVWLVAKRTVQYNSLFFQQSRLFWVRLLQTRRSCWTFLFANGLNP